MANQPVTADSFTLASRFLHALQHLTKALSLNQKISESVEQLNVSQLRILQLAHENPGIGADAVIERLQLAPDAARNLILAMERTGMLALDRSERDALPRLQLGGQGQRLAFQIQATQLSIVAALLEKLPEEHRGIAVEALEQLATQQLD